jgi:hypothetical protein
MKHDYKEQASSHCILIPPFFSLLDVDNCVQSGYNILREPEGDGLYSVAYGLDDGGTKLLVGLGRSVGECETCTGNGTLQKGFRAEVTGVVTGLGNGTVYGPPTIRVTMAVPSNGRTDFCSGRQPTMAPAKPMKPSPTPPSSSARDGRIIFSVAVFAWSIVTALALP